MTSGSWLWMSDLNSQFFAVPFMLLQFEDSNLYTVGSVLVISSVQRSRRVLRRSNVTHWSIYIFYYIRILKSNIIWCTSLHTIFVIPNITDIALDTIMIIPHWNLDGGSYEWWMLSHMWITFPENLHLIMNQSWKTLLIWWWCHQWLQKPLYTPQQS